MVSFNGISDFKMSSGKILFTVSADVKNPNGHKFKLFPSQLDFMIDGKKIGQLSNPDKHILKNGGRRVIGTSSQVGCYRKKC